MAQGPKVTISGSLPKGDRNGLSAWAEVMSGHEDQAGPKTLRLGIVLLSSQWTKTNHDKDVTYPVVAIRHIEMAHPEDAQAVLDALNRAHAERTGMMTLPLKPGEPYVADADDDSSWADEPAAGEAAE